MQSWINNQTRAVVTSAAYRHKIKKYVYEYALIYERVAEDDWLFH